MAERQVSLQQSSMQLSEFARQSWHVVPAEGETLEDVLKPVYWAHVANRLKPGDHIELLPEVLTYWAELLVIDVGRVAAKVIVLQMTEISANIEPVQEMDNSHFVAWKGPKFRWSIIRKSDSSMIKGNFGSRDEASKALSDYLRALAA